MHVDLTAVLQFLFSNLLLAVLVGFFSSFFFYLFLTQFKPRVLISETIVHGHDLYGGKSYFRIKVLNRTKFPIIDITAQLHVFKSYLVGGERIYNSRQVTLIRSNPLTIGKYDKSDLHASYAYRFVTEADLITLLSDKEVRFLRFRLICKHGFSNFAAVFQNDYRLSDIREGEFAMGDTFAVTVRDSQAAD